MLRQVCTQLGPKSRIAMTFELMFMEPDAPASHMTYVIEPQGDICLLMAYAVFVGACTT